MSNESHSFFSYKIFSGKITELQLDDFNSNKLLISTINPHSFYVADHDPLFKRSLQESHVLLPDGIGIVLANLLINFSRIPKISGMDIFKHLLQTASNAKNLAQKKVFFLGSTNENLSLIKQKIEREYPSLEIATFSPPFKEEFSEDELECIVGRIDQFEPYILFIGMTAPRQEKWAYLNFRSVNASITCSVGAVFDFYSGRIKRPGQVWRSLGLEWLGRFLKEPRRLWRRSLISLPYFVQCVMLEGMKKISSSIWK